MTRPQRLNPWDPAISEASCPEEAPFDEALLRDPVCDHIFQPRGKVLGNAFGKNSHHRGPSLARITHCLYKPEPNPLHHLVAMNPDPKKAPESAKAEEPPAPDITDMSAASFWDESQIRQVIRHAGQTGRSPEEFFNKRWKDKFIHYKSDERASSDGAN